MAYTKLRRAIEQINLAEGKYQQVVNWKAKLKVKQTEDSKLWQGFDSETSSTETLCDQMTETPQELAREKENVEASLAATEWQISEAKKHLKELSFKNDQMINEIHKKYELEKIEITNAGKEKAEKLTKQMENKCNEKMSKKKQDSERHLMHLNEEHGTMVARIQQDKEHNESTLHAYLKEELQHIRSRAGNELRERFSLVSKEHELQIKSLSMKHEEEFQRMQDELELQKSKEEKKRGSLLLQHKGMRENRQINQEVNSKKMSVKSSYFSFHQFRMASSNSSSSIDEKSPGNRATIILDKYNLPASRRSYTKAINKAVKWCKANTKVFDLSEFFGPGAEVFTTPGGVFHVKIQYKERELTLFLDARDLYLLGWESDKHGAFEIQEDDDKEREMRIKIPGCKVIKMGVNYHDISKHPLGQVRIGPLAMTDSFEDLYRCDGISYEHALRAVVIFAVNISEAIRDKEVCNEVEESFKLFPDRLDTRWDKNSGKEPLSANIRSYSFYSTQYLKYVDCMKRKQPLPKIKSRDGQNVISIHDIRNRIRVPLRDSYNEGEFVHDKRPKSFVWYPPYPDGKDWISEQEDEYE